MRHFVDHAADGGRIFALHDLIEPGKSQPLDNSFVLYRRGNGRAHPLDADLAGGLGFGGAHPSSCTDLPRIAATDARSRSLPSASKVALITLCGFAVPSDLVSTFCTPAEVITARTAPPAITPVPSGAGFRRTCPEPKRPRTAWGTVVCVRFTLIRFFLADSIPLRMACGTSLALPEPYPTTPAA